MTQVTTTFMTIIRFVTKKATLIRMKWRPRAASRHLFVALVLRIRLPQSPRNRYPFPRVPRRQMWAQVVPLLATLIRMMFGRVLLLPRAKAMLHLEGVKSRVASIRVEAPPILWFVTWTAQPLVLIMRAPLPRWRVPSTLLATAGSLCRVKAILLALLVLTVLMMGLAMILLPSLLASLLLPLESEVPWPMTIAIEVDVALPEMMTEAVFAFMVATMFPVSIAVIPALPDPKARDREVEDGAIPLATAWSVFGPRMIQSAPRLTDRWLVLSPMIPIAVDVSILL